MKIIAAAKPLFTLVVQKLNWREYSPRILAVALYIGLIALIAFCQPAAVMAYISDIFNASTMAETGLPSLRVTISDFKVILFIAACALFVVLWFRTVELAKVGALRSRTHGDAPPPTADGSNGDTADAPDLAPSDGARTPAGDRMKRAIQVKFNSAAQFFLLTECEQTETRPSAQQAQTRVLLATIGICAVLLVGITLYILFADVPPSNAPDPIENTYYIGPHWLILLMVLLIPWTYCLFHISALNDECATQTRSNQTPKSCSNGDSDAPATRRDLSVGFMRDWFRFVLLPFLALDACATALHCCSGSFTDQMFAMVGTGCLIGWISVAQAFGRLGRMRHVPWIVVWPFTWLPVIGLALQLTTGRSIEKGVQTVCNPPNENRILTGAPWHALFAPGNGPVVIICASGGGSRAAMFTAGMLTRMWDQDIQILKGDPDDAEDLTYWRQATEPIVRGGKADTDVHPGRLILQQTDVMSGVSGGSLACADFVDGMYRSRPRGVKSTRANRQAALRDFFAPSNPRALHPRPTWYKGDESSWSNSGAPHPRATSYPHGRNTSPGSLIWAWNLPLKTSDEYLRIFDMYPYLNAMRQDFVSPVVTGLLKPWIGRGPSYERSWADGLKWYDEAPRTYHHLPQFAEHETTGYLPALILNSTLTNNGSRLAITNLAQANFKCIEKFGCAPPPVAPELDPAHGRYDPLPGLIVTSSFIDPTWDIPLATAVHASANFPVALPAMAIKQPGHCSLWYATDGGLDDNYGLDSVMALIRAHRLEILRRGVLIFQIDPSFMSLDPSDGRWLFDNISLPYNAKWRSGQNADATKVNLYLRELCALLDCLPSDTQAAIRHAGPNDPDMVLRPVNVRARDKIWMKRDGVWTPGDERKSPVVGFVAAPRRRLPRGSAPGFAFFQVRMGEDASDQVMTSWHLDDHQRRKLYLDLCAEQNGKAILRAARWLRARMIPEAGTALEARPKSRSGQRPRVRTGKSRSAMPEEAPNRIRQAMLPGEKRPFR